MDTQKKPSPNALKQGHTDPANWIGGIFYYDKEDKRIFPSKRIPWMGWTINFTNPYSYLILLGFFVWLFIILKYILCE